MRSELKRQMLEEQVAWAKRMLKDTSNLSQADVKRLKSYLASKEKETNENTNRNS